jgi:transposase-like protein
MGELDQLPATIEKGDRAAGVIDEPGEDTLPPQQQAALELLAGGKSVAETARLAGVGRATVFRWLRNHPVFRAALNQWQDQIRSSCQTRLMALTDKATDAVEKALDAGDARSALQLLKGMGVLKEIPAGPTDPEEVRKRDEIEREERRIALKRDAAKLDMADMEAEMGI